MPTKVCLGGVTGWVGRELAAALASDGRFALTGAVARLAAGRTLREAIGVESGLRITSDLGTALGGCDVYVDFTSPVAVEKNVLTALGRGCNVVIGTSGLAEETLDRLDQDARNRQLGLFTAGNFAMTATLLQECAKLVARYIPHYELIDYAPTTKVDAPSSTARETAHHLSQVRPAQVDLPVDRTMGIRECRGGQVNGAQIHSVRLPSFHFGFEVIFGAPHERLRLTHEAGSSAAPYVGGTLLAIQKVSTFTGLKRGLQSIMDFK